MNDHNVIRPVFGKRKAEDDPSKKAAAPVVEATEEEAPDEYDVGKLSPAEQVLARRDLAYMLTNGDRVHAMRDKLQGLGDLVFSLKDFVPDKKSIRLRRAGLKSQSLEEICDMTELCNELQARSQPSFIGALTLEHHYRVERALSQLS